MCKSHRKILPSTPTRRSAVRDSSPGLNSDEDENEVDGEEQVEEDTESDIAPGNDCDMSIVPDIGCTQYPDSLRNRIAAGVAEMGMLHGCMWRRHSPEQSK